MFDHEKGSFIFGATFDQVIEFELENVERDSWVSQWLHLLMLLYNFASESQKVASSFDGWSYTFQILVIKIGALN